MYLHKRAPKTEKGLARTERGAALIAARRRANMIQDERREEKKLSNGLNGPAEKNLGQKKKCVTSTACRKGAFRGHFFKSCIFIYLHYTQCQPLDVH
jgi:hypothetical protein